MIPKQKQHSKLSNVADYFTICMQHVMFLHGIDGMCTILIAICSGLVHQEPEDSTWEAPAEGPGKNRMKGAYIG